MFPRCKQANTPLTPSWPVRARTAVIDGEEEFGSGDEDDFEICGAEGTAEDQQFDTIMGVLQETLMGTCCAAASRARSIAR